MLLGLSQDGLDACRALDYPAYLRPLGFKKSAGPLLAAIKREGRSPLLTKMADASGKLSPERCQLLRQDEMCIRDRDAPANDEIEKNFRIVEDFGEADQVLTKAAGVPRLAFVIHREGEQVLALSLTLSEQESYSIPVQGFVTADWLLGRLEAVFAKVPELITLKLKEELKCLAAHGDVYKRQIMAAALFLKGSKP